jgi:hypothetical protein
MSKSLQLYFTIIFGLVVSAVSLVSNLYDDAYIHARIVDNFFSHGEFSFNLGDTFKASSSTGYITLLSIINILFDDSVLSIRVLNTLALTIYFMLLLKLTTLTKNYISRLSLIMSIPYVMASSFGGMETALAVVMLLTSTVFLLKDRLVLALFFACMAVLFRVEFLLFILLLVSYNIVLRNFHKKYILSFLPLIALVIIDYIFYGSVIPHAASVKSISYNHPFLNSMVNALSLSSGLKWAIMFIPLYMFFSWLLWMLLKSFIKEKRFRLESYVIYGFFSLGVLFAWTLGASNIFPWYLPIVVVGLSLTIYLYFHEASMERAGILSEVQPYKYLERFAVYSIFIIATNGVVTLYNTYNPFSFTANERVLSYLRISDELYRHCPECSLLTSEIGGLGYGFKGKVLDGFGLGDPQAVKYHPMRVPEQRQGYGVGAIPAGYVEEANADFIVSMPVFTMEFRSSELLANYNSYFCPFRNNSVLWGDKGIAIHSTEVLPSELLAKIECKDFNNDS